MSQLDYEWTKHPLFDGLPQNYVDLLARIAHEESFEARELIFREGDEADKFYLVIEGHVVVEIFDHERGPITIQTVGPGDVLGWSRLTPPYRWHFDAQATTPVRVVVFGAKTVRDFFDAHPDQGYLLVKRFLPIITDRLQATRLQLLDVYHVHC